MSECTCGSQIDYLDCCALFIDKNKDAETPEALMRSRYTAYTQAKIDYIIKTMRGKPLKQFNAKEASLWASQVKWTGLRVIQSYYDDKDENIAYVEFIARINDQGKLQTIHELSQFQRIEGQWFYTEAQEPSKKKTKISRNSPCPCGSQKKYKNCHGSNKSC